MIPVFLFSSGLDDAFSAEGVEGLVLAGSIFFGFACAAASDERFSGAFSIPLLENSKMDSDLFSVLETGRL